jgi:lysophospholipase L1-like esterase
MGSRITTLFLMALLFVNCSMIRLPITVYSIGDSTMAGKKAEVWPETGWCQALPEFLAKNVLLKNHAVNGRSTRSFISEGRWKAIADTLRRGNYVFIQFGHNDEKIQDSTRYAEPHTTYKANLEKFVNESRKKGAIPVLFTSIVRRKFDDTGKLTDTHGDYPPVVREVAWEMNVPLVDLQKLTAKVIGEMGPDESKKMYLWTPPDNKFPEGRKDDTHLCVEGARMVAGLAAKELERQHIPLIRRKPGRVVK